MVLSERERVVYSERHPNLGSAKKRELQLKKW
jgi:predicted GIY-YIG superfamily endonuclease